MLKFNPIVTEQTTAATDLLLSLVAIGMFFALRQLNHPRLQGEGFTAETTL